jgi:hypothetical protein
LRQTCCLILPSIAVKIKQVKKKHSYKSNACSQCSVAWQTDAIGLQKCHLGLPSHLLSPRYLQQSENFPIPPRTYIQYSFKI